LDSSDLTIFTFLADTIYLKGVLDKRASKG